MDGLPPDEDGVGEMRGYLKDHVGVFEPDEVVILLAAFDKSWGAVQASGVRYPADKLEFVRAILAKHIIAAAINAVSKFSRYFGRSPDRLGLEDVHAFQVHLVATGISWPALNQIVCALRFFYGVTLGQAIVPERIAYAREPSKLPVVLSADEVGRFLEAIPSLKSRTALTTVYAAGLRVSEVVLLKIADIDSQRMVIRVEQGKGGKDRYVMLSPQLLRILRTYWRLARPKRWLFPGRDDERPLVPNVLHAACRSACAAAGLSKQVTVHTLRHTFATHLLESGADVRIIQVLLGHASLSSTARYTRVATKTISNTPSPLDRLRLEVVPPG